MNNTFNQKFLKTMSDLDLGSISADNSNFLIDLMEIGNLSECYPVIDASNGGFIKSSGSVFILRPFYLDQIFQDQFFYYGEILGGQYISNPASCIKYNKEFSEMESDIDNFFQNSTKKIPEKCKVFDLLENEVSFLLLSEYSNFIFSNATVNAHLDKIVKLDMQCS